MRGLNGIYETMFLQITSPAIHMKMTPVLKALTWQTFKDETPYFDGRNTLSSQGLWEQLNVTRDWSDYLWYMTE